ncbi:AAA family ATPase [Candidatus Desantisbacteria bacterium CG_4_9_14_3_um_filter_40_11]|uniref:AAA family ATPase n=1 Tax=Candidatus Desantisbacteria bacterium CG_4_9_14_3_um_filter_40_11 TaxID=1974546 RepID=A0A2M8ARH6_9BACT|nr:MAG: AAA family ATPase [Candidatus Desantisbacteria bacterium CG_4_9_14_3_um_filter_40_11]
MTEQNPAILLTGHPGIGKSTVIKKMVELMTGKAGGFYTREVRVGSERTGFEIVTLEGKTGLLATKSREVVFTDEVPFESYRINLDAMESVAIPALLKALAEKRIIVIDEIGPMEIFSERFCDTILQILENREVIAVGAIVQRPYRFADIVKAHPKVTIKPVTTENRNSLPLEIFSMIMEYRK